MSSQTMSSQTMASATPSTNRSCGRGYLWSGIGLCVLALLLPVVQYSLKILVVPWYVPALTTIAAGLLILSLGQRRTLVRIITLVLVAVLAGFEWFFLISLARLPEYHGPATAGQLMPSFRTTLADGRTFTNSDLARGKASVFVFFRGRW